MATFQSRKSTPVGGLCECPHFHFCLHQNQLMAQHGSRIAWTQHCCQWACCKAAHSDPFVSGQNAGEPGTKTARHCCSVLVQWGIKYLQSELLLHLRFCVSARSHKRKQHNNKLNALCLFPLSRTQVYAIFSWSRLFQFSLLTWPTGVHKWRSQSIMIWSSSLMHRCKLWWPYVSFGMNTD